MSQPTAKKIIISCAQKLGFKNREVFHNINWESPPISDQRPTKIVGDWLVNHDPKQYACDNHESVYGMYRKASRLGVRMRSPCTRISHGRRGSCWGRRSGGKGMRTRGIGLEDLK